MPIKILAFESTAAPASVALSEDEFILGECYVNTRKMHSQTLMPMAANLLESLSVRPEEIDLYAVACGPGSFTGVRIGVAAAKGMAVAHDTPCAPVSALESMALNLQSCEGIVCPVMDARRGQFYNALFEFHNGSSSRLAPDRAIEVEELKKELQFLKKPVLLVGDGAKLCYNSLKDECDVLLAPEQLRYQRAANVALLGFRAWQKGQTVSAESLLPVYLRLPQAERELKAKQHRQE